MEQVLNLLMAI